MSLLVLYGIVSYRIALYRIALYRIESNRIVSYRIVWHRIFRIESYRIVSYLIVSYRIVSYRIVSNRIVSHRIVSYRIESYRIVLYRIALYWVHCMMSSKHVLAIHGFVQAHLIFCCVVPYFFEPISNSVFWWDFWLTCLLLNLRICSTSFVIDNNNINNSAINNNNKPTILAELKKQPTILAELKNNPPYSLSWNKIPLKTLLVPLYIVHTFPENTSRNYLFISQNTRMLSVSSYIYSIWRYRSDYTCIYILHTHE